MLGKMFKHEWKGIYRVGCLMLILIAGVTFFGWLAFQSPMWQSMVTDTYYSAMRIADIMSILTLFLYAVMLFGIGIGILIYLAVHFYRTMYADEGYLTHTLPVTSHELLVSKILTSGLWYLLVMFAIALSIMLLAASLIGAVLLEDYTWGQIWRDIFGSWGDFTALLKSELGLDINYWFIISLLSMLVSPFITVSIVFGAISIGQLFTKHRVLMAIVSYVGIYFVSSIFNNIVRSVTSMRMFAADEPMYALNGYANANYLIKTAEDLVLAALLYFASYFVISRRLNME